MKCLTCGKVYTTRSSYYSHRRKRHPKLPRVEDIYRRGQKVHSGITNKSQLTKEGAAGKTTGSRRIGGSTGARSNVTNGSDISVKNVVNIKRKGDKIENITVKLSNTKESRRRRKAVGKNVVNVQEEDLDKLKEVANIVSSLETSPQTKSQKSPDIKVKQAKAAGNNKTKGTLKVRLKQPRDKSKKSKPKESKDTNKKKKERKRRKLDIASTPNKAAKLASVTDLLVKKKTQSRKKKATPETIKGEVKEINVSATSPSVQNNTVTKTNRRKSQSPKKSTGPRYSPLAIPRRDLNEAPITVVSPGSEERSLVQVAPVLTMKAYNSEGRPIHVKFVPVLAQTEDGEGSSGLTTEEVCETIQKQALDIAARVKDELVSSGVRVSSTSTEKSDYLGQKLIQGQSPRSKEINISPLISGGILNNSTTTQNSTQEENNNDLISSEPLDLSISSNNNNDKTLPDSTDNTTDYDPENVINITPIEYTSGLKSKNDGWVVPRKRLPEERTTP